ncbi:glycoside hydrolase family 16 protein [Sphingomonas sp. LB-2]|uniref:glycoside hydrolase family 16 protein n=1 Tax=Sphingomonas caeni TaxID=2984949 RepID=UPI00222E765B|nr:glycoside hydrolase family 16 protein [Sphingomonas caeni]MCW3846052.1 glycoside hydrolase family 16 protein [Sphingomonas caeni]
MKPVLALAAALAALLPGAALAQQPAAATAPGNEPIALPAGYSLVWSDEFDQGSAPDRRKWRFDTSRNKAGWYNNELQYYAADRPENVRIEHGVLVIEARKERLSSMADYGGQHYSSGKLVTQGTANWQYGYFEIRAKLSCGKGMWPAIWMLGSDGGAGWPGLGEIDIMEMVAWDPTTVHGTIHTAAYNHVKGTQKGARTTIADTCGSFHTYQLDWNADRILIGVDGHAYMRFDNDHKGNHDTWPFASPQYLILNVAIGGWGGQQGVDPAAFPSKMEVDYVRVYQKR